MIEPDAESNSTAATEKILKLTVEARHGSYHYYMDEVNWSDNFREAYYSLIPAAWIVGGREITKDAATGLLYFIKARHFRFLGSRTSYRYEIIDYKSSFISKEDWEKQGWKTVFRAKTNGEILPAEMAD